jgi:uncharacterized protein YjiS (DUF1127 family)
MTAITLQPCRECPEVSRRRAARNRLRAALRRAGAVLREWRRRSRDRRDLAALDARALLDIGLSRADAEFIANKPFWRE